MKDEKGITLVALIITVVVTFILTAVSIRSGTESLENTRLKGFYSQLEIVQKRVDDIAATNESYVDGNGDTRYLKEQGISYDNFTDEQKTSLDNIIQNNNITVEISDFSYFTVQELEEEFDLSDIEYDVFINFDQRIVIASKGITVGNKTYHVLENATYFIEQDESKNIGTIESLRYTVTKYGDNNYKVIIEPTNTIGDLGNDGYVKYKKTITKYWETSNNREIILDKETEYNIIYIDKNGNKLEKIIKLEIDENDNIKVTEL